jgi:type IV pilus assembly protein PilM
VDGEVRNRSEVASALRRLWSEGGFREKRVHIGVAGLRAITRELDMPAIPPDELNDAVRFRADEVIPFPMERTAISAKVIAQYTDDDGAATLRVLVAAAHLDLISSIVGAVEDAGLEPVAIDLNTAALVRAISAGDESGPEAIVSVGAGLTLVVVHEAGVLQFVRTIDLGGESVTRSIASALDIPEADAESVKRRLSAGEPVDSRVTSAAAQAVSELVDEIQNSVRFFSSQPGRAPVSRLLITGGGAQSGGLFDRLQEVSSEPVIAASPLTLTDTSRLPITAEQAATIDPTLAVPIGLALPDQSGHPFNLLPPEFIQKAAERKIRRKLLVGAGALLAVVLGLSGWRVLAVQSAKHNVNTVSATIAEIQTVQIPKYNKAVALKAAVEAEEKEPIPVLSGEVDWMVVLNQISQYQPTNAVIAGLTMEATPPATSAAAPGSSTSTPAESLIPADETIATVSTTVTVPNLPSVTQWGQSMTTSPVLTDVLPSGSLAPVSTGVTFSAAMNVDGLARSQRLSQFEEPLP